MISISKSHSLFLHENQGLQMNLMDTTNYLQGPGRSGQRIKKFPGTWKRTGNILFDCLLKELPWLSQDSKHN